MIDIENYTKEVIDLEFLQNIVDRYTQKDVELVITDDEKIAKINFETRGIDKATDVLSFPLEDFDYTPLGSIVISIDRAREVAKELNHTLDNEIKLLFIHGFLHLLGFDHEKDSGEMRDEEKKLITELNLPKSLIVRNS